MSADVIAKIEINVLKYIQQQKTDKFYIAFSGGIDSCVITKCIVNLLHNNKLIGKTKKNFSLLHINHNLEKEANIWVKNTQILASLIKFNCIIHKVAVQNINKFGYEAAARISRYQAFSQLVAPNAILITAHHLDDQAETFLLQAMRGAGILGLSGMQNYSQYKNLKILRPMLDIHKDEIFTYAKYYNLQWSEDSSNNNLKMDRNFLRQKIIPALKTRRQGVLSALARSASHCQNTLLLLNDLALIDLQNISYLQENLQFNNLNYHPISAKKLSILTIIRQANAIRFWLKTLMIQVPSNKKLQRLLYDLIFSRYERKPQIILKQAIILRIKDKITLINM